LLCVFLNCLSLSASSDTFIDGYGPTLGEYIISKGADRDARNNAGKAYWDGI
jgi:hypothetical protein